MHPHEGTEWQLRLASAGDVPALEALIRISVNDLQAACYSAAQRAAALGTIFGVDRQLIDDGTYFVVEREGEIIACGGWSKRRSRYGSDHIRSAPDDLLDPARDSARIRAFFVRPMWARRGLGRALLLASERALRNAGFRKVEIVATLSGEPLYKAGGYSVTDRFDIPLPGGLSLPAVTLSKTFV